MKLYVDDIRKAPDESWHTARTVEAAISAIVMFDFEIISLDHDISHQISIGVEGSNRPHPCSETFTSVAYFIKAKYAKLDEDEFEKAKPKIIIHTANPAGAIRIAGILKDFEVERKDSYPANRLETEL